MIAATGMERICRAGVVAFGDTQIIEGGMKPSIFVASSVEQLELAYAIQEGLEHDAELTVWSQSVFLPSRTTMASLVDQLDVSDFGIFVLAPDDVTTMRKETHSAVRDNVVFELGLFAGRLGHERCFLVTPRGSDDLKLPTDLLGITPAEYDADRQDKNMVAALGAACNRIRKAVKQLGKYSVEPTSAPIDTTETKAAETGLIDDANDCVALIQTWMGRRPSSDNVGAIKFNDVDKELGLAPGSARIHIGEAAKRWGYTVDRVGKDTILFKERDSSRIAYF